MVKTGITSMVAYMPTADRNSLRLHKKII
nr:hypothetical protein LRH_03275 [Lacticaseibacillus rhamnosus HN001]